MLGLAPSVTPPLRLKTSTSPKVVMFSVVIGLITDPQKVAQGKGRGRGSARLPKGLHVTSDGGAWDVRARRIRRWSNPRRGSRGPMDVISGLDCVWLTLPGLDHSTTYGGTNEIPEMYTTIFPAWIEYKSVLGGSPVPEGSLTASNLTLEAS